MGNYQRNIPKAKSGIENRKAYLVGGGIGSLSAAAFLIRDAHMPAENIHILEESNVFGGSMDGAGNAETGYTARGGREIEPHFECFMDLYSTIPSIKDPNRTVLDEFYELNQKEPIESHCRLVENQGQVADFSSLGLNLDQAMQLAKLVTLSEEKLGATTVEQFFDKSFLNTNFWYYFRTMFAFENWHSVVEVKRYVTRFMHMIGGLNCLKGLLHTEYNQYDSLILPLIKWLEAKGVCLDKGYKVTDLDVDISDKNEKIVKGIHVTVNGKDKVISVGEKDIVLVTNGSMTENSDRGDFNTPAKLNRDTKDRGCWSLWERLSKKSPDFGHPEAFCGDVDKTNWLSFTITLKDDDIVFPHLLELTHDEPGMGGIVTIKDSNWMMSWTAPKQPHFMNQPENVKVLWAYGLFTNKKGNYINKTMQECTGKELFEELCYHMGLKDQIPEILKHTVNVIPCMMPYITAHFMPRVKGDRPEVVPNGSRNLGFLGQYAEVPDDCVFTVEYSIRTAMTAVYKLLGIEKEITPVYPSRFDVRVLANATKACLGLKELPTDITLGDILKDTVLPQVICNKKPC